MTSSITNNPSNKVYTLSPLANSQLNSHQNEKIIISRTSKVSRAELKCTNCTCTVFAKYKRRYGPERTSLSDVYICLEVNNNLNRYTIADNNEAISYIPHSAPIRKEV